MTLMEVITALAIMTMIIGGVLATLLQTRRLGTASIAQSCAITIVQGYVEQLKNIPFKDFINGTGSQSDIPQLSASYSLPTKKDQTSSDPINTIETTPPSIPASTLLNGTPGVTPTGVYDNLQSFDMDSTNTAGTTTWAAAWPGANTSLVPYPTNKPGANDLRMNFWVQITDLTPNATPKCKAYGILIVYTWQYIDGGKIKYAKDSVRTIRSAVQTF